MVSYYIQQASFRSTNRIYACSKKKLNCFFFNDLQIMKDIPMPHSWVLINIPEVITHKLVVALSEKWTLFLTKPKYTKVRVHTISSNYLCYAAVAN